MPLLRAGLIASLSLLLFLESVGAAPDETTVRWIEEVLLGGEFKRGPKYCTRWTSRPTLSIVGADDNQEALVKTTVGHLNETLANTEIKGIRYLGRDAEGATIVMHFAPIEEFPKIARRHRFKYVEGNWGYFATWRGLRSHINRSVILIASQVQAEYLHHLILEELTQCLGPQNDSEIVEDSVYYSKFHPKDNPTTLTALDQKLLLFLYHHVAPGTRPKELRTAIEKYWDSP